MADIGGSHNDAFGLGINHQVNPGRQNLGSLTMGTDASGADQGLDATSARWNGLSPHSVLASTVGGSQDDSFERMERAGGSYAAGQMPGLQDQISAGSDEID